MISIESNNVFDLALKFINNTQKSIFLTGKAGTGKTTFLKYLYQTSKKKMAVIAPTGIAAVNANGVTIHSFFNLPVGPFLPGVSKPVINFDSEKRKIITQLDLLVIDEVSMLRADTLDFIDYALRIGRKKDTPFGEVQILYIGDLYQIPPIVTDDEKIFLKGVYKGFNFFESIQLQKHPPLLLELDRVYRQKDITFISFLNKVRVGTCSNSELELINTRINKPILTSENNIFLTTHNAKADLINREALKKNTSKEQLFYADVSGDFEEDSYPTEKCLILKLGARVMLIRNDRGKNRIYYNGKTGTITKIKNEFVSVLFDDNTHSIIEKETWNKVMYKYNDKSSSIEKTITGSFKQFPLRLAWAVTIHKSQGLTLDSAIIDLANVFTPGQVYVALSRLKSLNGLYLSSIISLDTLNYAVRYDQDFLLKIPDNQLDELFEFEKSVFVSNKLKSLLNWIAITSFINKNSNELRHIKEVVETILKYSNIVIKFCHEVTNICASKDQNKYILLQSRTKAAINYFISEIRMLLNGTVKDEYVKTKDSLNLKFRFRLIKELRSLLENKLQDLHSAEAFIINLPT